MITKTVLNEEIIQYINREDLLYLNILYYLKYNKEAEIFLYNDSLDDGIIVYGEDDWMCFFATNNLDFQEEFLQNYKKDYLTFSAIPLSIAQQFIQNKEFCWSNTCKVFVFNEKINEYYEDNYNIETLTLEDTEEVHYYFTYKNDDSLKTIKTQIETRDNVCIRINGELAGWCLVHIEDYSIGPLYVKKKYRGKDLPNALISALCKKLQDKDIIPYGHVVETNWMALSLAFKANGFEHSHDCIWFGLVKDI